MTAHYSDPVEGEHINTVEAENERIYSQENDLKNVTPMTPAIDSVSKSLRSMAQRILAKCEDPDWHPNEHSVSCRACYGSGWVAVYKNGVRQAIICSARYFERKVEGEKTFLIVKCNGNPEWQEIDRDNRADLIRVIFRLLEESETDDTKFFNWVAQEFRVKRLEQLMVEQLEAVIAKIKRKMAVQGQL